MQAITAPKPVQTVEPASQAPYRALFECAPVGILIGTAEGACIDANHSLCEMLGFTHEELVGLRRSDYVADTEIPTGTPSLDVIRTHSALGHTDAFTGRVRQFRPKDGSTFEAEVLTTVMPDGTRLEFIQDTAERKTKVCASCSTSRRANGPRTSIPSSINICATSISTRAR